MNLTDLYRSASLFIGTSFTVANFTIFATSNVDSIVGIPHKIYSMQRILICIKNDLFVKCAHLHPGYAANLVARERYYHCHWTLSKMTLFSVIVCNIAVIFIFLQLNYHLFSIRAEYNLGIEMIDPVHPHSHPSSYLLPAEIGWVKVH